MRPSSALIVLPLAGALALQPACAAKAPPSTAPAPSPAPRSAPEAPPVAPLPAAGAAIATGGGVYRPAAPAPMLGHVTRAQVRAYAPWQPLFAEPYVPDPAVAAAIRAHSGGLTVLLVMGTWCPDSRREMPRFFAIMDGAGIGDAQLTMVGVDRTKKDAEGLTEKWGITRVPTFVFLRNGQEVGRVVERTPAGATLEGEIARLLALKL